MDFLGENQTEPSSTLNKPGDSELLVFPSFEQKKKRKIPPDESSLVTTIINSIQKYSFISILPTKFD